MVVVVCVCVCVCVCVWCRCVFLNIVQELLVKHLSLLSHFYSFATLVGGEWNAVEQRTRRILTNRHNVRQIKVCGGGGGGVRHNRWAPDNSHKGSVLIWSSEQDMLVFVGETIELEWTWNPTNPAANERRPWHWTRSADRQQWGLSCTESARVVHPAG